MGSNRLRRIEERLEKASRGPWIPDGARCTYVLGEDARPALADFIHDAPTDIAYLLRVAHAAVFLAHCSLGHADGSWQLEACDCDGCGLRKALEGGDEDDGRHPMHGAL